MNKEPNGTLMWNMEEIARALKISAKDVQEYFTDVGEYHLF